MGIVRVILHVSDLYLRPILTSLVSIILTFNNYSYLVGRLEVLSSTLPSEQKRSASLVGIRTLRCGFLREG